MNTPVWTQLSAVFFNRKYWFRIFEKFTQVIEHLLHLYNFFQIFLLIISGSFGGLKMGRLTWRPTSHNGHFLSIFQSRKYWFKIFEKFTRVIEHLLHLWHFFQIFLLIISSSFGGLKARRLTRRLTANSADFLQWFKTIKYQLKILKKFTKLAKH